MIYPRTMNVAEEIEIEVKALPESGQHKVLAFVKWMSLSHDEPQEKPDEADLEWAAFENHAARASD